MDNHNFILKLSRLFPSSCHFRTLPDVAETSITLSKTHSVLHENDPSSLFNRPPNPKKIPRTCSSRVPKICKTSLISGPFSDAEGRKCPPVTPISSMNPKKMVKFLEKSSVFSINHSSSSNSGWFTSSDEKTRPDEDVETDAFFSLSSNSGDSFRLKTSRRFRRCEEMQSIDETGRCSFSSAASSNTVPSKCSRKTAASGPKATAKGRKKTWPENELGPDQISTELYYRNNSDPGTCSRRRKAAKNRRRSKKSSSRKSLDHSSMIGESYAVEKSSNDPHSDFRASMVEMIVEKQILAAEDLERLLLCFLSLNAVKYHGIIFDVFNEICRTLFAN